MQLYIQSSLHIEWVLHTQIQTTPDFQSCVVKTKPKFHCTKQRDFSPLSLFSK